MHPQASVGAVQEMLPSQPRLSGIVLAQVVGVSPSDHAVQVIFTTGAGIATQGTGQTFKVKVLHQRAGLHGPLVAPSQIGRAHV